MPAPDGKNPRPAALAAPPPTVGRTIEKAVLEQPPSLRYHLIRAGRDIAMVAGLAALTYASSDDFANILKDNPEIAAWVPVLQLAARAILVSVAKAKAQLGGPK